MRMHKPSNIPIFLILHSEVRRGVKYGVFFAEKWALLLFTYIIYK